MGVKGPARFNHQSEQIIHTHALQEKSYISSINVTTLQYGINPVTIQWCQFAIESAAGLKILILLHCLYLSYQHHVKEQYYQLATCEPSEETAQFGKRQKLFSGLQHIFLDNPIHSHVIIKMYLASGSSPCLLLCHPEICARYCRSDS
jgi:hypothetical protein